MNYSSGSVQPIKISLNITIPANCEPYANDIRRFVDAMIYKLSLNASKGRWEKLSVLDMQAKLSLEVTELNEAIENRNTVEILLEAADVANFALIIANIQLDGQHE